MADYMPSLRHLLRHAGAERDMSVCLPEGDLVPLATLAIVVETRGDGDVRVKRLPESELGRIRQAALQKDGRILSVREMALSRFVWPQPSPLVKFVRPSAIESRTVVRNRAMAFLSEDYKAASREIRAYLLSADGFDVS